MASFAEQLKKSLAGMSEDFLAARNDLLEEVLGASRQVEELTQGRVKLGLAVAKDDETGAVFSLLMLYDQGPGQEITGFKIGLGGYPIVAAPSFWFTNALSPSPPESVSITSREAIGQFFTQLASDRNSPLVRKLAFVLRKK